MALTAVGERIGMRFSYVCLVGVSVIAGSIVMACSSSSGGPLPPGDSGSPPPIQDAGCVIDADLSIFTAPDAADPVCAACLLSKCSTPIRACETDCLCGGYYVCVAYDLEDAGLNAYVNCAGNMAHTAALESNAANLSFYNCITKTCAVPCGIPVDAGGGG